MTTALVPGSLGALAKLNNQTLAESFLTADHIILLDRSYSMTERDAPGGRTRYQMACDELARLQESLPGKIALVSFDSMTSFVPGGMPEPPGSSTDLTRALEFVKPADGTVSFVLISDGYPDNPLTALTIARGFASKINVVYCGPETDRVGRQFLSELAQVSGGKYLESLRTANLGESVTKLLKSG